MYLTDFREQTLQDVITQLEPGLFYKVTGLSVRDFELLVSLGVFNNGLMNDAVYKFRRYEDASLTYTGINKHKGEHVGLFDTSLSELDYLEAAQQDSLIFPNGLDRRRPQATQDEDTSTVDEEVTESAISNEEEDAPESPSGYSIASEAVDNDEAANNDWLIPAIEAAGLEFIDKRDTGGNLWVIGDRKIVMTISELNKQGASFKYRESGGKATKGKSAWWMK